jgi:hypothetical protein
MNPDVWLVIRRFKSAGVTAALLGSVPMSHR